MARAYKVQATNGHTRYAGTQAQAREIREAVAAETGVLKKHVTVEEVEIPTGKADLIAFINELLAASTP